MTAVETIVASVRALNPAGRLKAHGRISLADCIGLALVAELNATFLTADRHELAAVASRGSHAIQFIR